MREPVIPHSRPSLGTAEVEAAAAVLRSGQVAQGPQVAAFEAEVAARLGLRGGAAVASGTAALHLALLALEVGPGDAVLIPSYTCAALLHAVRLAGAEPLLADVDPATGNMDPEAAARAKGSRCRALIPVHTFGWPADVEALRGLGVPIIEDCAQALGATAGGRPVGSSGEAAICSFYATKLIATGEGGMVLSSQPEVLAAVRDLRAYDEPPDGRLRFNYKMTDLQAAVGRAQLGRLPEFLGRRAAIAATYRKALADAPIALPPEVPGRVYYRFVVRVPGGAGPALEAFARQGVTCRRPVHTPLHRLLGQEGFSGAEEAWRTSLSLPCAPALTDGEVTRVAEAAQAILGRREP
ncbi:MAG TPA: aminotransferase class I/II-fold pyridoxal phosphate-dependent enzyme [Candidatus Methylomirabilis sp.]|nr:aminotransferase class I/II-fold pyridoxal phosphate-dependent enzyme [Candidatus Methylomirabilis sp.]